MTLYDPYDYRIQEDPYSVYRTLRDEHPAYWNDERGFWALSRYEDVRSALLDPATFSSAQGVVLEDTNVRIAGTVITTDPPRHGRLRGLLNHAFTLRRVTTLEPAVRRLATGLLDATPPRGRFDFMEAFAKPLPTMVISDFLGIPASDRRTLLGWSDALLHREPGRDSYDERGGESARNLHEYLVALVGERRRRPEDDLLSALVTAVVDGERLSDDEVVAAGFMLFVAGNETTTSLIGNAVWYLWGKHADQRSLVERDPALVPFAIEELLRYDAPTQGLARTLTHDVSLHGETLRNGQRVFLLFGSANRDERAFPDPDRLDVLRRPEEHFAFGYGRHFCLGAALARMEARVALELLLERARDLEVVESDPPPRVHSGNQRGIARLEVARLRLPEA